MLTATEFYLAAGLDDNLKSARQVFWENDINSQNVDSIKLSEKKRDLINGNFRRVEKILDLFKEDILLENNYVNLVNFKREASKITNTKQFDDNLVIKKLSLLEDLKNLVGDEVTRILDKETIVRESSRYVSFVCLNKNIKEFVVKNRKNHKLLLDGEELNIQHISSTEDAQVILIDKKEYLKTFNIDAEALKKRNHVNALRKKYREQKLLFAPHKLGLALTYEAYVEQYKQRKAENRQMPFKQYLSYYVEHQGVLRLRYHDIIELIAKDQLPNVLVTKQISSYRGGVKYNNGWSHSKLTDKKFLARQIESDKRYEDPKVREAEILKWKKVYEGGKKFYKPKKK